MGDIKTLLNNFVVDGEKIPVAFITYSGASTTYITYNEINSEAQYRDDRRDIITRYYDFGIYTKKNYTRIEKALTDLLEENEYRLQISMCSGDLYEDDTGYYHKTLCFAKEG